MCTFKYSVLALSAALPDPFPVPHICKPGLNLVSEVTIDIFDLKSGTAKTLSHAPAPVLFSSITIPNCLLRTLISLVIIFKTFMKHKNLLMCCPLSPVLSNHPTDAVDLSCCLDGVNGGVAKRVRVVGCCNGLVYVAIVMEDKVFLWNPATRKCNELPKPEAYSSDVSCVEYGFGYDEYSCDYKVVAVVNKDGAGDCLVEVYSWRMGRWKRIQDFPGSIPHDGRSTFVNGRLYKLGRRFSGHIIVRERRGHCGKLLHFL